MTGYAVRKNDGSLGVLLINKSTQSLDVAVDLPAAPQSVSGRRIGWTEYEAVSGPVLMSVQVASRRVRCTVPGSSIAGFDIR
jgi:hypothetical protein